MKNWFFRSTRDQQRSGALRRLACAPPTRAARFEMLEDRRMLTATFTTLHSFADTQYGVPSTDGSWAFAGLINNGTTLFGTTTFGGSAGLGTLYSINPDGSGFKLLHSFTGATNDGQEPETTLTLVGSTLYGTTLFGGASGDGTVFSINTNGTGFDVLYSFSGSDYVNPSDLLALNGVLYGTTEGGGTNGAASIFSINANGSNYQVLRSFTEATNDGGGITSGLASVNGVLFGTTTLGGTADDGVVYSINANGSSFKVLHSFGSTSSDGVDPIGNLQVSGSTLYGVTTLGGPPTTGGGTIYSINTSGSSYQTVYAFSGSATNGLPYLPESGVTLVGSTLYGTTDYGGPAYAGTFYNVQTNGTQFTVMHDFTGTGSDGADPNDGLTLIGGTLYGTTQFGGVNFVANGGGGTVFSITGAPVLPAPVVTTPPPLLGSTVTLSAADPPGTFQWQISSNNGLLYSDIPGATALTYSFTATATTNGNLYRVVFTEPTYTALTASTIVTVGTALTTPTVTSSPTSQTITAGGAVTFNAAASGNPGPTVQWQVSTNNGNLFADIPGATSTTYSFNAAASQNGNQYRAVFTNSQGSAITSVAKLAVTAALVAPVVTTSPTNQTVAAGQSVKFTAAASGSPTPTVQWQVSTNKGNLFVDIPGATATTYSFTTAAGQSGNLYRAVFTNSQGSAITSYAKLAVTAALAAPVVTTGPTSQTIAAGHSVTFTAAASGNPAPTVQWQVSTNNGNLFVDIPGATSLSYSFIATAAQNGYLYRAVFTNSQGTAITSAAKLKTK